MRFRARGPANKFGSRRDQRRVLMLAGALVIVLFSIFKTADPRYWTWLRDLEKRTRTMTAKDEQQVRKLQEQLTAQAIGAEATGKREEGQPAPTPKGAPARATAKGNPALAENQLNIPGDVFKEINEAALYIRRAESEAYWTVLTKVRDVPEAELEQAALQDVSYTQVFSDPDYYRGKLVTIEGELVKLAKLPPHENNAGIDTVYEGWMINADSGKNPYVFHCLDKPAGLKAGEKLSEKIRITGYFFKRYQYAAKSGLTYAAPMFLVKRIRWFPSVQRKAGTDPGAIPWMLGGVAAIGVTVAAAICWFILREQRKSTAQLKRFIAPLEQDLGPIEPPPVG